MAMPDWRVDGPAVAAYVIRGNWVADCPFCRETIVVEPGQPFTCPNCTMAENGGKARPLAMPEQRAEIEAALLQRPVPDNRNWLVGETVEDLVRENRAHGVDHT